eukprot:TRINITY_DN1209_c0_g1_i1.p1 TRINITY_DN1209_c0_g1~~TRINITY_DN1209_c0_g1_i1.p1  ORF type:complete len:774 (+),score=148.55 TRINITY_DN1209_c0_g1_i1:86-2323(+)
MASILEGVADPSDVVVTMRSCHTNTEVHAGLWALYGSCVASRAGARPRTWLGAVLRAAAPPPQVGRLVVRADCAHQPLPDGSAWPPGTACRVAAIDAAGTGLLLRRTGAAEPPPCSFWAHMWVPIAREHGAARRGTRGTAAAPGRRRRRSTRQPAYLPLTPPPPRHRPGSSSSASDPGELHPEWAADCALAAALAEAVLARLERPSRSPRSAPSSAPSLELPMMMQGYPVAPAAMAAPAPAPRPMMLMPQPPHVMAAVPVQATHNAGYATPLAQAAPVTLPLAANAAGRPQHQHQQHIPVAAAQPQAAPPQQSQMAQVVPVARAVAVPQATPPMVVRPAFTAPRPPAVERHAVERHAPSVASDASSQSSHGTRGSAGVIPRTPQEMLDSQRNSLWGGGASCGHSRTSGSERGDTDSGTFSPSSAAHSASSGGGPSGRPPKSKRSRATGASTMTMLTLLQPGQPNCRFVRWRQDLVNDMPVWRGNAGYLVSDERGHWCLTSSLTSITNAARLRSTIPHGGNMPQDVQYWSEPTSRGGWKEQQGITFVADSQQHAAGAAAAAVAARRAAQAEQAPSITLQSVTSRGSRGSRGSRRRKPNKSGPLAPWPKGLSDAEATAILQSGRTPEDASYGRTEMTYVKHAHAVRAALEERFQEEMILQAAAMEVEEVPGGLVTTLYLFIGNRWDLRQKRLFASTFAKMLPVCDTEPLSRGRTHVILIDGSDQVRTSHALNGVDLDMPALLADAPA